MKKPLSKHRNPGYANYSVLEANILDGLEGAVGGDVVLTHEAHEVFLQNKDKHGPNQAERLALQWASIGAVLNVALPASCREYEAQGLVFDRAVQADVRAFIRERFRNNKR
jgi:hypothetical protein